MLIDLLYNSKNIYTVFFHNRKNVDVGYQSDGLKQFDILVRFDTVVYFNCRLYTVRIMETILVVCYH